MYDFRGKKYELYSRKSGGYIDVVFYADTLKTVNRTSYILHPAAYEMVPLGNLKMQE